MNESQNPQEITKVYNVVILDASGSMGSIHKLAVDSVNETIQTVKSAAEEYAGTQQHFFTLVSFNTQAVTTLYNNTTIGEVEELAVNQYRPYGGTPLYDAIGQTLTQVEMKAKDDDRVLVTIITDGYENASHEYSGNEIRHMIERLRKKNWNITYIGANQDVERVSESMGIQNCCLFDVSIDGMARMNARKNRSMKNWFGKLDGIRKKIVKEEDLNSDYFDN